MNKGILNTLLIPLLSASELSILYLTILYTLYKFNTYTLFLTVWFFLKSIILSVPKYFFKKYTKMGKRPKGAFNCNMFSCGGPSLRGGMPSGHMSFLFMLFSLFYLNSSKIGFFKTPAFYLFLGIALTTGFGRWIANCHTILQIVIGCITGSLIGYIVYKSQLIFDSSEKFKQDKRIFYKDINIIEEIKK
jgi:membrane-associated phospholipid phosphatase